jgi:hypothetical protein
MLMELSIQNLYHLQQKMLIMILAQLILVKLGSKQLK